MPNTLNDGNSPIRIPGAVFLPNGYLQFRLRNGVLLVIPQSTLRQLQNQGVDVIPCQT